MLLEEPDSELFRIPGVNLEGFLAPASDTPLPRSGIRAGLPERIDLKTTSKRPRSLAGGANGAREGWRGKVSKSL